MAFLMGFLSFILGTVLVAVCLVAIPGPEGAQAPQDSHSHGHGAH